MINDTVVKSTNGLICLCAIFILDIKHLDGEDCRSFPPVCIRLDWQVEEFVGKTDPTSWQNSWMVMGVIFSLCICLWQETEFFHKQGGNCSLLSRQPLLKYKPAYKPSKSSGQMMTPVLILNTLMPKRHSLEHSSLSCFFLLEKKGLVMKQICQGTPCLSLTRHDRCHSSRASTREVPSYLAAAPPATPYHPPPHYFSLSETSFERVLRHSHLLKHRSN